ncbi:EAL domain-containing protein [Oxalobacter sp. OttesenSCG-928-P03]|nr:EAL domain-containing protein [Oxalobacter sp. OttesenSCG-928-P03]
MKKLSNNPHRVIAEEIIERSPSVALRVTGENGKWITTFITENISAYGYNKEDFLSGKVVWTDIVHPDDIDELVATLDAYEAQGIDEYTTIYRILKSDGTPVWINDNSNVVRNENGEVIYADCIIADYTDTKKNLEKIGDNLRQQAVLNDILQGLHNSDLDESLQILLDRTGVYLDISRVILFENNPENTQCKAIYEWCNEGISSMGEFSLDYQQDIPEIKADLEETGRSIINFGDIPVGSTDEFENEGVIAAAIFAVYIQEKPFGFICFDECVKERQWGEDTLGFLENISKLVSTALIRRRNERIIRDMALTDRLTGLSNRYHLETCLAEAYANAQHAKKDGYVLFIDMDDFKVINDGYGHDYGDIILKEFANFLKEDFGGIADIFRFGGDEFVILLHPEHADSVYTIINSLLARAQLPWNVIDKSFYCTLSIGVVRFPEGSTSSRDIIKNADIAMYQAKRMGKNSYAFYTGTLDNDSIARAEIEKEMRESIDNQFRGFSVVYQPLTHTDGNIIGAEALLRWTLSTGQPMSPAQFIPLAEYLGLIIPLGEFVLREAALFCRSVNETRPDFCVSINISIRQFQQQDFMERVLQILKETGVSPSNINFEITESMAMHDIQRVKTLSEDFRQHGIRISMDDFGMGYSSLGNMRELPIDVVKIDRTFIRDVSTDSYSKSFIRLITDLVHSMERKVCIEGVETGEQLDYCRECSADYVQGFLICRPIPPEQLLDRLDKKQKN